MSGLRRSLCGPLWNRHAAVCRLLRWRSRRSSSTRCGRLPPKIPRRRKSTAERPAVKTPTKRPATRRKKSRSRDLRRTQPVNFETEILPLLGEELFGVPQIARSRERSGSRNSRDDSQRGRASGPAVVPGHSGQSRLLQLASHEHRADHAAGR